MQPYSIGLPPELFATAFPFHIVLDSNLQVVQVGATLLRVCPTLVVGAALTQCLRITLPAVEPTLKTLRDHTGALFLLDAIDLPLRLRGQMSYVAREDRLYFLGSPWVTRTVDLAPLGLTLQDFAIHDPIVDLLVLFQTQQLALDDAKRLTAKLSAQRQQLRQANGDLAARFAEQQELQNTIVQLQAATLAELSTPLIPITDDLMVMPLIGKVDPQRAQMVLDTLLHGVAARQVRIVILDVTGVSVVDSEVANALMHVAQAVQLLGAAVLLTGIRPEVAQTLVSLNIDLRGISTHSTLQAGIAAALRRSAPALTTKGNRR